MGVGFGQILLILIGVLMVFGAGRLPSVMADLAKGMRAFKKGLSDESDDEGKVSLLKSAVSESQDMQEKTDGSSAGKVHKV